MMESMEPLEAENSVNKNVDSLTEKGDRQTELNEVDDDRKTHNGETSPDDNERISTTPVSKETVEFKIVYNKQKHDVTFPLDETIAALKQHILTLTGLPPAMQKVMCKGLAKDDRTLRQVGVTKGAKVMVVGSTLNDVLAVNTTTSSNVKEDPTESGSTSEPLCKQKLHKKVLDKGVPDEVMPGIKNEKESLPPFPISGMLNKAGDKVRLTFKLELDQIWIGTKERTEKIRMSSIKNVISEPIEGHEEYHILALQLGPTEASRYWLYWFPAQFVDSIKDAVLGKWQFF